MPNALKWNDTQVNLLRVGFTEWPRQRLEDAIRFAGSTRGTFSWSAIKAKALRLGLPERTSDVAQTIRNEQFAKVPKDQRGGPVWTVERIALLHQQYARHVAPEVGSERINELPGPKVTASAYRYKLKALGLHRGAHSRPKRKTVAIAAPAPKVAVVAREQASPNNFVFMDRTVSEFHVVAPGDGDTAHQKRIAALEKATAMLMKKAEPTMVAMQCKLPMREVFRLVGEVREMKRATASI